MWENGCIGLCCKDFTVDIDDDDPLHDTLIPLYRSNGWNHFTCSAWDTETKGCTLHNTPEKPQSCIDSGRGCNIPGCEFTLRANRAIKEQLKNQE